MTLPATEPTSSAPTEPTPRPQKAGGFQGFLDWFWCGTAIARARAAEPRLSDEQRELLRRARLAHELADRLFEPIEPLRHGATTAIAAELCQQSLYWSLLASLPEPGRPPPAELWTKSEAALRSAAGREQAADPELLSRYTSFIDLSDLPEEQQNARAALLRRTASGLLASIDAPKRAVQRVQMQRGLRLLLALVVLVALVALGVRMVPEPRNLALDKPWSLSSRQFDCDPKAGKCGGASTKIFFHTQEENGPWIEYDLGARTRFSRMVVRNRSDYGERAVPLVVEVSNDRKAYKQIAWQRETFSVWTPHFETQQAQFVRLRVPRKTFLHLEAVEIYR